jgi:hypothetical protein
MTSINDRWPDPECMPDEVKQALHGLHELGQRELAEIDANPRHRTKSWWHVDKTKHGAVIRVYTNKPSGAAAGLWSFEPTVDDDGRPIIAVQQHRHVDDLCATPADLWHVPADVTDETLADYLSDLVGRRSAAAAVARLERRS